MPGGVELAFDGDTISIWWCVWVGTGWAWGGAGGCRRSACTGCIGCVPDAAGGWPRCRGSGCQWLGLMRDGGRCAPCGVTCATRPCAAGREMGGARFPRLLWLCCAFFRACCQKACCKLSSSVLSGCSVSASQSDGSDFGDDDDDGQRQHCFRHDEVSAARWW